MRVQVQVIQLTVLSELKESIKWKKIGDKIENCESRIRSWYEKTWLYNQNINNKLKCIEVNWFLLYKILERAGDHFSNSRPWKDTDSIDAILQIIYINALLILNISKLTNFG